MSNFEKLIGQSTILFSSLLNLRKAKDKYDPLWVHVVSETEVYTITFRN